MSTKDAASKKEMHCFPNRDTVAAEASPPLTARKRSRVSPAKMIAGYNRYNYRFERENYNSPSENPTKNLRKTDHPRKLER